MMWLCTESKLISLLAFALSISAENLCKAVVLLLNVKYVEDASIFQFVVYENNIRDNLTQYVNNHVVFFKTQI